MGRTIESSGDAPGQSIHTGSTRRETDTSNMECAQSAPLLFVKHLANGVNKGGGSDTQTSSLRTTPRSNVDMKIIKLSIKVSD